ncbi:unnamed protein product [Periconia digitata]|uniref:RING-type domain-containing protein n=1 Tax=Periconia digitata TaxID=1303443 RepID=A0A9W4XFE7_9PLEO|nr:unnamed protein product [Periconia digitata]
MDIRTVTERILFQKIHLYPHKVVVPQPPDETVCTVCNEPFRMNSLDHCRAIQLLECSHIVGDNCFRKWLDRHEQQCLNWNHHLEHHENPQLHDQARLLRAGVRTHNLNETWAEICHEDWDNWPSRFFSVYYSALTAFLGFFDSKTPRDVDMNEYKASLEAAAAHRLTPATRDVFKRGLAKSICAGVTFKHYRVNVSRLMWIQIFCYLIWTRFDVSAVMGYVAVVSLLELLVDFWWPDPDYRNMPWLLHAFYDEKAVAEDKKGNAVYSFCVAAIDWAADQNEEFC